MAESPADAQATAQAQNQQNQRAQAGQPTQPGQPGQPQTPAQPAHSEPTAVQDVIRQLREAPVIDNQVSREVHLSEEAVKAMIEALEHATPGQPSARSQAARTEDKK